MNLKLTFLVTIFIWIERSETKESEYLEIITRQEWRAKPPLNVTPLHGPAPVIIIKHTAGSFCKDPQSCTELVARLQYFLMQDRNAPDIWYNFVIGGDGKIYEGRGWDIQSQFHKTSMDICFMGNFTRDHDELTPSMIKAAELLIAKGVEINKITGDYKVVNHNQTWDTASPGENVYKEVMKWAHFYRGRLSNSNL